MLASSIDEEMVRGPLWRRSNFVIGGRCIRRRMLRLAGLAGRAGPGGSVFHHPPCQPVGKVESQQRLCFGMEPCEQIRDSTGHLLLLLYSQIFRVLHFGMCGVPISLAFPNPARLGTRAERAPEPDFAFVFSSNLSLAP